jgi:hypothetical protein
MFQQSYHGAHWTGDEFLVLFVPFGEFRTMNGNLTHLGTGEGDRAEETHGRGKMP